MVVVVGNGTGRASSSHFSLFSTVEGEKSRFDPEPGGFETARRRCLSLFLSFSLSLSPSHTPHSLPFCVSLYLFLHSVRLSLNSLHLSPGSQPQTARLNDLGISVVSDKNTRKLVINYVIKTHSKRYKIPSVPLSPLATTFDRIHWLRTTDIRLVSFKVTFHTPSLKYCFIIYLCDRAKLSEDTMTNN